MLSTAGSVANSMYASSTTVMTCFGILRMNARSSLLSTAVPVGLFGLQMNTSFVLSVTAAFMASRSNFWSGVSGQATALPLLRVAALA